jgi:UDP-N-acetylglucosamine acyltransferase
MGARHPTAVVDDGADVHPDASIGPYAVVGPGVRIGARTRVGAHAVIEGPTEIGPDNEIFPHAVLGTAPQDRRYAGEPTRLSVGPGNRFREHVTVHRGTAQGRGETRIGAGGLFMAGCHVAHDCVIGDGVVLANGVQLAGHVEVAARAVFGGLAAVAQTVRIGEVAMVAAGARVERDVPPFHVVSGDRARIRALNRVGLDRAGIDAAAVAALERAHRMLFRSGAALADALDPTRAELGHVPEVARLLAFLHEARRGVCGRERD